MLVSLCSSYDNISILLLRRQDQKLKVKEYLSWTMTPVKQARTSSLTKSLTKRKDFVYIFLPYFDMWFILDPFVISVDRLIRLHMKYKSWLCVFVSFAMKTAQYSCAVEYCFVFTTYTFLYIYVHFVELLCSFTCKHQVNWYLTNDFP